MLSANSLLKRALLLGAFAVAAGSLQAAVKLPALFSDHMVLQRADKVPVWGWAKPGEAVQVRIDQLSATTTADAQGKWKIDLNLEKIGQGPYTMSVSGENHLEIADVVIGQVWLASGQSNMEWRLVNSIGAPDEIKAGAGNGIREFRVARGNSIKPLEDVKGEWVVAEPGKTGGFSAVAYFFAKKLHAELKQPVGILHSSWGGAASESWTSSEALASDPELKIAQEEKNHHLEILPQLKADFGKKFGQWLEQNKLEDAPFAPAESFYGDDVDTADWVKTDFESKLTGEGLQGRGVFWLRREVNVPAAAAGKELTYQIDEGKGFATFYWNGHRFGGPEKWTAEDFAKQNGRGSGMWMKIPGKFVKEGKNVFAIRIYSPVEAPGRIGWRNSISGPGGFNQGFNRSWQAKLEKTFTVDEATLATAPKPFKAADSINQQPARLYNAMIAPLVPYRLAGVIWYQGETNAGRAAQYARTFPLMIEDWRTQWGEPNLPFYFCQLANYKSKKDAPGESDWAELREAQTLTLRLPHTGQAVIIDVGESDDIHPRNKTDVGERLALLALANDYGRADLVDVGPTYEQKAIVGGKVYLKFKDEGAGTDLVARELPDTYLRITHPGPRTAPLKLPVPESQLQGFAICGADKKWVWAHARIEGKHGVVVWSPEVPEPVAVRYAWADNPTCNLYNAAGLPAVPFRTDDFKRITENARY